MKAIYRIVNFILGALMFPATYFIDMFYVQVATSDSETLKTIISTLSSDKAKGIGIEESLSIKRMVSIYRGNDPLSDLFDFGTKKAFLWPEEMQVLNVRIGIFAASFVIMLIAALFIIVWSCCSNKRLPNLIAGIIGLGCAIAFIVSFQSMSNDIYTGKVDAVKFIADSIIGDSSELMTLLSSVVGVAASKMLVLTISLSGAQNAFLFIFGGVIAWTVIYYVVDIGDPEAKKAALAEKTKKHAKKAAKAAKAADKKAETAKKAAEEAAAAAAGTEDKKLKDTAKDKEKAAAEALKKAIELKGEAEKAEKEAKEASNSLKKTGKKKASAN